MKNEKDEKDRPAFELRLKDIRVACWKNKNDSNGRFWYHVNLARTYRSGDDVKDAPGSLNGRADIALAIAGLEAAGRFIEQAEQEGRTN